MNPSIISLAVFGDSIANGTLFSNYPYRYDSRSFAHIAAILSGGAIHIRDNKAVPGRTTNTLASNFNPDLGTLYPTYALICCGINDVGMRISTSVTSANILSVVDHCIGLGIQPILCTVTPRDTASGLEKSLLNGLNDEIRYIARQRGCILLDLYARAVNPETELWLEGYTSDGIHPNNTGALFLAESIVDTLGVGGRFYNLSHLAQTKEDARNLIQNGIFQDFPDGWSVLGSGAQSIIEDENILGNWCQIIQSSWGQNTALINDAFITDFSPGDRLSFAGRICSDLIAVEEGGGITVKLEFVGSTKGDSIFAPIYLASESYPEFSAFSFEGIVPNGATSAKMSLVLDRIQGSVRIAQVKVINLTKTMVSGALNEPEKIIGTRGKPHAIRIQNLTGNVGIDAAPSSSTIGPSLTMPKAGKFNNALTSGTIYVSASDTAILGAGEDDLKSVNLGGNQLSVTGDYVIFSTSGIFSPNNNGKRIRAYLGSSKVFDSGCMPFNGGSWCLDVEVTRLGSSLQTCKSIWCSDNSLLPVTTQIVSATENLSSNQTFKLTGKGESEDIIQKTLMQRFYKGG